MRTSTRSVRTGWGSALDKQMIPGRLAYEHTLCAENLTVGNIGAKKVSSMLLGESDRFVLASREHSLEPGASDYSTGVDRINLASPDCP